MKQITTKQITFKELHDSANPVYFKLYIQNFNDMIYLQNCLFMLQIEQNQTLALSFLGPKLCGDKHSYMTRSVTQNFYDALLSKNDMFGKNSVKYNCISD